MELCKPLQSQCESQDIRDQVIVIWFQENGKRTYAANLKTISRRGGFGGIF